MSQVESLKKVLLRDIKSLQRELDAYDTDEQVWELPNGIRNSAGTLVMHLCGNLRHFVGHGVGQSGYVRNREYEFAGRDVPRAELKKLVDETATEVAAALDSIDDSALSKPYPSPPNNRKMTIGLFLVHLSAHLGYHLGQIDYHRRVVTGNPDSIGAVATTEIGE